MRMHHFGAQNGPFAPNKFFLGKLLIAFSSNYRPVSLCKIKKKKSFQQIQSYEDAEFLGPKWPTSPSDNFSRKPVNVPCFFHSCLSTCQKSRSGITLSEIKLVINLSENKIIEILLTIKKYWNLTGREPFWAITWKLDFSQACSFHRMLMNHKSIHFSQISDNTNDVIFLKSPKTMLLGHFWSFLANGDFFQKIPLCHTQLYMAP